MKVGFIGTGFIARFMAASWNRVRDADVVALYNPNIGGAKTLANYMKERGLPKPACYEDIYDLLHERELDAVWILSPNYARIDAVKAVVEEVIQGKSDIKGICCEKPLGRTTEEATQMLNLVEKAELLHGYLENQVFAPSVVRGRELTWNYGAKKNGRPFIARASEEHGGPHNAWFWDPIRSGGGVLLDMACHSIEASKYLLTDPKEPNIKPRKVNGKIKCLKWKNEPFRTQLLKKYGVDYSKTPSEDYASVDIEYEAEDGNSILSECRTSWCYTGPGLRLSMELLGPEYSMSINSLQQELNIFMSRNVDIGQSEDFVEKQTAEQGLMPVISDEASIYGYVDENRHMVECFRRGVLPRENWYDGLRVIQLMMLGYKSAEERSHLDFNPSLVERYVPLVAQGKLMRC